MTRSLTLSVLHLTSKDQMVMRSLLNLVSGRAADLEWRLSAEAGGDVTIVDVDNADGQQAWAELVADTSALVALSRRDDIDAALVLKKPLRSREFLGLLGRLAGHEFVPGPAAPLPERTAGEGSTGEHSDPAAAPPEARRPKGRSAAPRADGAMALADHLRAGTWSGPVALTSPGWPMLLIDPCSGTWFFDGTIADLDPVSFSEPLPERAGVALSNAELVEQAQGRRQRALSELKWYAGLAHSPGLLHPELRGELQFMLTQVPPEAMKNDLLHDLARICLRGPIDLEGLLETSGQPEPNVVAFLNACFCSSRLLINRVEHRIEP